MQRERVQYVFFSQFVVFLANYLSPFSNGSIEPLSIYCSKLDVQDGARMSQQLGCFTRSMSTYLQAAKDVLAEIGGDAAELRKLVATYRKLYDRIKSLKLKRTFSNWFQIAGLLEQVGLALVAMDAVDEEDSAGIKYKYHYLKQKLEKVEEDTHLVLVKVLDLLKMLRCNLLESFYRGLSSALGSRPDVILNNVEIEIKHQYAIYQRYYPSMLEEYVFHYPQFLKAAAAVLDSKMARLCVPSLEQESKVEDRLSSEGGGGGGSKSSPKVRLVETVVRRQQPKAKGLFSPGRGGREHKIQVRLGGTISGECSPVRR